MNDNDLIVLRSKLIDLMNDFLSLPIVTNVIPLKSGEDAFLMQLYLRGRLSPTELSNLLKITKGRVTALINSLSKKELIEIKIDANDRRKIVIDLSFNGQAYLDKKLLVVENQFTKFINSLGKAESENLIATLEKAIENSNYL